MAMDGIFDRSRALLGESTMNALASAQIAVVGVGGVGSWCAEALVRTGFHHITLVDDDVVAPSNVNRQLEATSRTIGQPKVEALGQRLLEINPEACVTALALRYAPESDFHISKFDCVVDAIDSVADKAHLIRNAMAHGVKIYSSMGAALRLDPTRVRISEFSHVTGDGLARALRQRFKKDGLGPAPKFQCVHSEEPPRNIPERGSTMPVTAAFGLALASLVTAHFNF